MLEKGRDRKVEKAAITDDLGSTDLLKMSKAFVERLPEYNIMIRRYTGL